VRARARLLVAGATLVLAFAACRSRLRGDDLFRARREHARMRAAFAQLSARDPVVTEALAQGGDLVVGIRPALVQAVLREVAGRYLDRVALDLPLDAKIHETNEVEVGTFLGRIHAGDWTLDVTIHRVRGTLRAGVPHVSPAAGNALALSLPVRIEEGHGTATVHFKWESHSVASVVCHDFELTRPLAGLVLPRDYALDGTFELSAGADRLRAEPRFPPREFRIQVDLTPKSWNEVRAAIEEQDQVLRCGLGIDSDKLLATIRDRLHEGFDITLPRSIFRTVDFPAAVRQDVAIEDKRVDLAVRTHGLAITPAAVWYAADVRTRIEANATPSPSASASAGPSR